MCSCQIKIDELFLYLQIICVLKNDLSNYHKYEYMIIYDYVWFGTLKTASLYYIVVNFFFYIDVLI